MIPSSLDSWWCAELFADRNGAGMTERFLFRCSPDIFDAIEQADLIIRRRHLRETLDFVPQRIEITLIPDEAEQ